MSANENGNEMDEAREAKRRAEEMLSEVKSQRPEIKRLSDRAAWLIHQNNFQALVTQTIGGRT
jgi:hypothetical protein